MKDPEVFNVTIRRARILLALGTSRDRMPPGLSLGLLSTLNTDFGFPVHLAGNMTTELTSLTYHKLTTRE